MSDIEAITEVIEQHTGPGVNEAGCVCGWENPMRDEATRNRANGVLPGNAAAYQRHVAECVAAATRVIPTREMDSR